MGPFPSCIRPAAWLTRSILYDPIHKTGNGFVFTEYTKEAFIEAVEEALKVYKQKAQMEDLLQQALRYRFSWEKSAKEYVRIYQKCLS